MRAFPAAEVTPVALRMIWRHRIPAATLSVIAGKPGRAWRVYTSVLEPPALMSLTTPVLWPADDWLVAECGHFERGPIPHDNCHCGIYAARSRLHLAVLGYNAWEDVVAIGDVALAGDVIPGERGWRAERARPLQLWLPHEHWQLVRPLSQTYCIPVALSNVLAKGAPRGHRT